jgi:hypothetical protein
MNIRTLTRRESWMTDAEWRQILRHRRAILKDFTDREVPLTVFIGLRLNAYLFALILTQRNENAILTPAHEGAPLPIPTPEQFDALIAAREKLTRLACEIEHGPKAAATPEPAQEPQPEFTDEALQVQSTILTPAYTNPPNPTYQLNRQQRRALARRAA